MTNNPLRGMRGMFDKEEGFSLVEVLAAMSILAIVTIGTVPLFVAGIKSTLVSKLDTGAKNLSQERLEQMRNLAFHVDVDTADVPVPANCTPASRTDPKTGGILVCDYRDMLDTYYRSGPNAGQSATSTVTGGYVSAATARDSDEPAGAFYRFVINPVTGFSNKYSQFIATQFLTADRAAVTPPADYNSQISGKDFPPSRLVGVTMITKWTAGTLTKRLVSFTQIAEGKPSVPSVVSQARAIAISITGDLPADVSSPDVNGDGIPDGDLLILEAGLSNANGAVATGASAAVQVTSAFASRNKPTAGTGQRVEGKSQTTSAPPNTTTTDDDRSAETLFDSDGTTVLAAFGITRTQDVLASIAGEQPLVGKFSGSTLLGKASGRIKDVSGQGSELLGYFNKPQSALITMPLLDATKKMVRIDDTTTGSPPSDGSTAIARGQTHLYSQGGVSHRVESGAYANTQTIKILPTLFAPNGVINVTLTSASLVCQTNGTTASATPVVSAVVQYWNQTAYTTVADINNLPDPTLTLVMPGILLSNYITGWAGSTAASVSPPSPTKSISASMTVMTITTQPTRTDLNSQIGIRIGQLSCLAEDKR